MNPRCETPTCLSRQKRVAKGPFRPYTVLSARTLATFLASQDHPERGLCPHYPVLIDRRPLSPSNENRLAGKKIENRKHLHASPRTGHATPTQKLAGGIGPTSVPERTTNVYAATGHNKTIELEPEASKAGSHHFTTFEELKEMFTVRPKNDSSVRKDKDPKSFTQSLFDTVAMKLLHRADSSSSHPPWAPSNQKTQVVDSSNIDSKTLKPTIDERVSESAEKGVKRSVVPNTGATGATHGDNSTRNNTNNGVAFFESDAFSSRLASISDRITRLEESPEHSKLSGNIKEEDLALDIGVKDAIINVATSPVEVPDSQSKELDLAAMTALQKTSVSTSSHSRSLLSFSAQSLSHFTHRNITALTTASVLYGQDMHEQHRLLKHLGRTDLPHHSSRCGSYGDFLAYSGQSMIYILSNVDALLQSFLHCDDSDVDSKVLRPYEFPLLVDLFQELRRIDMHPKKIFPSLYISAGRLYPTSANTSKRRPVLASGRDSFLFDPILTSHGRYLNDLEACHVVKIILAALVAYVPNCSPLSWLAVRKLHASGQVAPSVDTDDSPAEQKMIGKLVRVLQAFENETALGLVIRFARSIDTRYHLSRARALAEDAEKNRRQFPPTFSRVLDYVNSNSLKIRVTNKESQPSVKYAEWIDPEIGPITWHPKEWPIIIEWLRAVILKEWDGKAKIAKGSAVGGALGLLLHIRRQSNSYLLVR